MALLNMVISKQATDAIKAQVGLKSTPIIYDINPPPGTAVSQGTTIEVHVVSPSDVNIGSLIDVPPSTQAVPLDKFQALVLTDPTLKALSTATTLPTNQRAQLVTVLNTKLAGQGLAGTVTDADADKMFNAIKTVGTFSR